MNLWAQDESFTEIPDPITAAEQALILGEGTIAQPVPPASAMGILRMVLTLAAVAIAVYALVFLIKKASRGSTSQDPFLKILASTPLGAGRSAHIVSVGSRAWLVGSAEHGVSLISEIDDKETLDAMLLEDSRKSAAAFAGNPVGRFLDFKALLRRLGVNAEAEAPGPDEIRRRRQRIKEL